MGYFAISPLIGSGTMADPYRAKAQQYGAHVAIIPVSPTTGQPIFPWAFVYTEADPALLDADNAIVRIPENRLDRTLNTPVVNRVNQRLADFGAPPLVSAGMTVLEAINAIGSYLVPGWTYADRFFYVNPAKKPRT